MGAQEKGVCFCDMLIFLMVYYRRSVRVVCSWFRVSVVASTDCRLSVSLSVVVVGSWFLGVGCWLSVVDGCAAFLSVFQFSVPSSAIFACSILCTIFKTAHLPPLRFHCVGGCWDRTQDCCDFGIGSQTLYPQG